MMPKPHPAPAYALPGGKLDVATRSEWVRSMIKGTLLFGPKHRKLMRATRSDDRVALHEAERTWARSAMRAIDLSVNVHGLEHIDTSRSYIVAPLHEGFTDLLALQHVPLAMIYATAEELFSWEHLGPFLRSSHQPCVSLTDGPSAYRAILRAGKQAAARHESLVVFPQGTVLGIETAFLPGAFKAAEYLDMPVLPIVLTGSAQVWDYPFSTRLTTGKSIRLEVLPAILARNAVAGARAMEEEMKDIALASTPPPRRFVPSRDGWWDSHRFEIDGRFSDLRDALAKRRATHLAPRAGDPDPVEPSANIH
ncbi:MAG: 1-acyl-sn-glycerol-3-phosphate acyltransferase [Actinomycetia bacterium]|nr:1-acyl-sn-glycerol-3-phosphate acyltransferase [Actinomycetes bacterium]